MHNHITSLAAHHNHNVCLTTFGLLIAAIMIWAGWLILSHVMREYEAELRAQGRREAEAKLARQAKQGGR